MSTLKVNKLESKGTGDAAQHLEFAANGSTYMQLTSAGSLSAQSLSATQFWGDGSKLSNLPGGGKVLQVVSTFSNTHTAACTQVALLDTGISVSITPSSTSSKIFLTVDAFMSSSNTDSNAGLAIYRSAPGGSAGYIGVGDNGSNNNQTQVGGAAYVKDSKGQNVGLSFLDSPNTTDVCTYNLYFNSRSGSYTTYLNRTVTNSNNDYMYVGGTTITAMEISG